MSLSDLGFGPALAAAFVPYADSGLELGRVTVEHRGALVLHSETEEIWADVPGRLRHRAATGADLPAVGDWVAFARQPQGGRATIEAVLPRRTAFVRKAAGFESVEQVVAANVDIVFVVTSLVDDLNPRRLERYLALAWESGAEPVVVLTKSDLCESIEAAVAQLGGVTFGVPAHVVSAVTGEGIDELTAHVAGGRTATLVGSSGVGKSTLVNRLCGSERLATAGLRARRARPPHDHASRAGRARNRRLPDRHARHARAHAVGRRGGARAGVRGRRGSGRGVPVLGLRASQPSPAAQCRRRSRPGRSTPAGSRASATCSASCATSRSATTPAPARTSASAGGRSAASSASAAATKHLGHRTGQESRSSVSGPHLS